MNDRSSSALSAQMLSRRDVLIGAAAAAGALVLGVDGSAHADASSSGAPVSVAYWNGVTFVDPLTQTPQGYLSQTGATVWLGRHSIPEGTRPSLLALDVHFSAIGPNGDFDAPFFAWTSKRTARFKVPISPIAGLALSIQAGSPAQTEYYFLSTSPGSGYPMLRTGTYVIAAGTPWWPGLSIIDGVVVDRGTGQRAATELLMLKIS